jgi:hypothetical protein
VCDKEKHWYQRAAHLYLESIQRMNMISNFETFDEVDTV